MKMAPYNLCLMETHHMCTFLDIQYLMIMYFKALISFYPYHLLVSIQ